MAELYHCPCCNKFVKATHFKRAPWTDEDLSELLAHPRLQRLVEAKVRDQVKAQRTDAVRRVVQQALADQVPRIIHAEGKPPREVPAGWITYKEASAKYNYTIHTLRHYVMHGAIEGGRGIILESSIAEYAAMRTRFGGCKPRSA